MDLQRRQQNQINQLRMVFEIVDQAFKAGKPLDRVMTRIFRKNPKYGSKDRRFISNSIFGYYRWYGWLSQLSSDKADVKLLLGYLFDGNPINQLIEFWSSSSGVSSDLLEQFKQVGHVKLEKKSEIVSCYAATAEIRLLNPSFFPKRWNLQTVESFQDRPNLWVRFVEGVVDSFLDFLESKRVPYQFTGQDPNAMEILSPVNLNESLDYRAGKLEVQDITSQMVGKICQPNSDETWWDVCAGSGGKALHLSSIMKGTGIVYASEIDARYFGELKRRSQRNMLYRNIKSMKWDGSNLPKFKKQLDGILIDAPCSCSGTWRRSPELRWTITKEQIYEYAERQFALLLKTAPQVSKESVMVYATCSIFPEENEQVIERFLGKNKDFCVCDIANEYTEDASGKGVYLVPPKNDGNGMYVSRLRRQ